MSADKFVPHVFNMINRKEVMTETELFLKEKSLAKEKSFPQRARCEGAK